LKKRLVSILIVAMFLTSVFLVVAPVKAAQIPESEPMHIAPEEKVDFTLPSTELLTETYEVGHNSYYNVGDIVPWILRDAWLDRYYLANYQLRAIGTTAEIWVAIGSALGWKAGDPRPTPTILDDQVAYMLQEFENNIYPTDTSYFGDPDFHDGSNSALSPTRYYEETGRSVVLVSNIRDQNWHEYGPPPYPYYVIGFYSSTIEFYTDRNVISIDAYDWEHRVGPEGYEWIPGVYVNRPYTLEGTIAHEYQHLIHADRIPGDSSYMNEGCSMYAEVLCGYGVSWDHVNSFLYTPDNSLTKWGDQGDINILADYGASTLWAIYLNDNYSPPGDTFLHHYMEAGIPADYGINAALAYFGYDKTFNDVYYEWNLANYLHSHLRSPYGYKSIDMNPEANPDIISLNIHKMKLQYPKNVQTISFFGSDFGTTETILGYDTGVVDLAPYSSDYIFFNDWDDNAILSFNGGEASEVPYGWEMVGGMWFSDGVDLLNTMLTGNAYVDALDPTLEINTYWDMEDYWDFGFVQVSTDGGLTWTSLANEYTTTNHDPSAYAPIVANLPGLTSWSGFIDPDGWITMNFDLTAYAGQNVMLGFRYMTDWGTRYEGWYIESVAVSGNSIPLTSFQKVAGYPSYFTVTVVYMNGNVVKSIQAVDINHLDETGQLLIPGKGQDVLLIVSNPSDPTEFAYGVADYQITITKT